MSKFYCDYFKKHGDWPCSTQCDDCKDQPIPVDNTEFLKKVNAGLSTWTGKDAKPVEQDFGQSLHNNDQPPIGSGVLFGQPVEQESKPDPDDFPKDEYGRTIIGTISFNPESGDLKVTPMLNKDYPEPQPEQQDWKGELYGLVYEWVDEDANVNAKYDLIEKFVESLISPLQADNEKLREQIRKYKL